jgi:hypothetical protein
MAWKKKIILAPAIKMGNTVITIVSLDLCMSLVIYVIAVGLTEHSEYYKVPKRKLFEPIFESNVEYFFCIRRPSLIRNKKGPGMYLN